MIWAMRIAQEPNVRLPNFGQKNHPSFSEDVFFFFWSTPKSGEKNRLKFSETFFFGEHLILNRKTVPNSVKTFFFVLEIT